MGDCRAARAVVAGVGDGVKSKFDIARRYSGAIMPLGIGVEPETPGKRCLIPTPAVGDGIYRLEAWVTSN